VATMKVYFPIWTQNKHTGRYGWEYAAVNATIQDTSKVPEGEPCVRTGAMDKTPPERLQPDPTTP